MGNMADTQAVAGDSKNQARDFAPLHLKSVRIRGFRGITECQIEFEDDLTVLVGPNNVGKSRVMRALALALGAATASRDDFTVGQETEPTIDVVLAPSASSNERLLRWSPGGVPDERIDQDIPADALGRLEWRP